MVEGGIDEKNDECDLLSGRKENIFPKQVICGLR